MIIQIASHFGARRQEAQRLGRILRPKARTSDGFNAFFYTLISKDTQEMFYSSKRQQFLVDQGYAFKVVTNLAAFAASAELAYSSKAEQRTLLQKVLLAHADGSADAEEEMDDAAVRSATLDAPAEGVVSRKRGSMSELSGGDGLRYKEMNRGAHTTGGARSGPRPQQPQGSQMQKHRLLQQRANEKKKARQA